MFNVTRFNDFESTEVTQQLFNRGIRYLIDPSKGNYYQDVPSFPNMPRVYTPNFVGYDGRVRATTMPLSGIVEYDPLLIDEFSLGLQMYLKFAHAFVNTDATRNLLLANLSRPTAEKIELYLQERIELKKGTVTRIDAVPVGRRLASVDTNYLPLGLANQLVAQSVVNGCLTHGAWIHLSDLAELGNHSGIVTQLTYPGWMAHAVIADMVSKFGVDFYVIPYELLEGDGSVDGKKLQLFYEQLYSVLPISTRKIPDKKFTPPGIVRCCREKLTQSPTTQVVNPFGQYSLDSHILTTMPFVPGIDEFMKNVGFVGNFDVVRASHMPGTVARHTEGLVEIAVGIEYSAGETKFIWSSGNQAVSLLLQIQQLAGIDPEAKNTWYVKNAGSTGKKGIMSIGKSQSAGLLEKASGKVASMFPDGEIFTLQPHVHFKVSTEPEVRRGKFEAYFTGPDMYPIGSFLMTTQLNSLFVHGGSSTDLYLG